MQGGDVPVINGSSMRKKNKTMHTHEVAGVTMWKHVGQKHSTEVSPKDLCFSVGGQSDVMSSRNG